MICAAVIEVSLCDVAHGCDSCDVYEEGPSCDRTVVVCVEL